jgi:hypothetical protein
MPEKPLPNWVAAATHAGTATWRSGYAAVCKTVYPGSIPGVASNKINHLRDRGLALKSIVSYSSANGPLMRVVVDRCLSPLGAK